MYRLFNIFFVTFWKTRQHVQIQDANTMFTRYYQSQQDICVDETLVGTRGRTAMLQYIPSKQLKFWVKIWVLVESATDIRISRKTTTGTVTSGVCQRTSVVLHLSRKSELLVRGYHVYVIVFPHLLNLPRFCCAWGLFLMAQLNIIGEFHPPPGSQYAREHNIHAPKTYYAFCGPQGNEKKRHVRFFVGFLL